MTSAALVRRAALGCSALVLVLVVLALPHPVVAQEAPSGSLSFASASPYVAQAGGVYKLSFYMDAPADAKVTVAVGLSLTIENNSRDVLDAMAAGSRPPAPLKQFGVGVGFVPQSTQTPGLYTLSMTIAPSSPEPAGGFALTDAGVYPVTVSLLGADDQRLAPSFTTYMIVLAANTVTTPMSLAPIVPLSAPLSLQPDGSYVMSEDDGRRLANVQKMLIDHPRSTLTVDPTPETVDALGHLNAAVTPVQLANAVGTRPVLAGPYVDLDEDAWADADLTSELSSQLTLGAGVLEGSVANGRPLESGTWIARRTLSPAALDQLKAVGTDRLVLPSGVGALDPKVYDGRRHAAAQFAEQQPFDVENDQGGRFRAVTADSRLAARLTATDNPALNAQLALADLALLYCGPTTATRCQNLPAAARGVALDVGDSTLALDSFGKLLTLLATPTDGLPTPMVSAATVRQLLDLEPANAEGTIAVRTYTGSDPEAVPSMTHYRDEVRRLQPMVGGYESMVATTAVEKGTAMRRLLDVSGADVGPARQDEFLASIDAELGVTTGAISAPAQEPATLTASDAVIQVRIENRLDYAVTIRLELSSDKLEFSDGRQRSTIDQVLAPKTTTGVKIDVRARASGTFSLDTEITSPDGSLHLDESSLEVRSTAVSQLGLVLTISAGFFLLAWWIKHFRATRRARKLVDPSEAAAQSADAEREHEPV